MCTSIRLAGATLALLAQAGAAQAALHGRDLDAAAAGFEAWYDDQLDVTWMADANLAATQDFGVAGIGVPWLGSAGGMAAGTAQAWIAAMNAAGYLGFTDWRLPRAAPLNGTAHVYTLATDGSTDIGYRVSLPGTAYAGSTAHEMAHLFYNTLGNPAIAFDPGFAPAPCAPPPDPTGCLLNRGPFSYGALGQGESGVWWSADAATDATLAGQVHGFDMLTGHAGVVDGQTINLMAWAVRDGDVLPVPEPGTWALWCAGLAGLAWRVRRAGS